MHFFEIIPIKGFNVQQIIQTASPHRIFKIYRLCRRIEKKYNFLVAARMIETIFFYSAFYKLLKSKTYRAVIACSDANPYALGLLFSAKRLGIKTIYSNHGQLVGPQPALFSDSNFLFSQALRDLYGPGKVTLRGLPGTSLDLRKWQNLSNPTYGILLSMTINESGVINLIRQIQTQFPDSRILIRTHPNLLFINKNLSSKIYSQFSNVSFSHEANLENDLNKIDIAFIGNSSVHLEALKLGVATIYCDEIDSSPHDYYGFVRQGLVYYKNSMDNISIADVSSFYSETWKSRMSYFDAGYQAEDYKNCIDDVKVSFHETLGLDTK